MRKANRLLLPALFALAVGMLALPSPGQAAPNGIDWNTFIQDLGPDDPDTAVGEEMC